MPKKTGRYGIKIWILANALTLNPIDMEVYIGKQQLRNKSEDVSRL